MTDPIVIVGGGQAAVQLCLALRKEKVSNPVLMLSEELDYPYHRPPLSKSFMAGDTDEEKLSMRPESFYESKDVTVELGATVTAINTERKEVVFARSPVSSSDQVPGTSTRSYHSLVIATGARPRVLSTPGAELHGVHLLRDLEQSKRIKSELENARNIVVVGAGFIGLEFAAVANAMGKRVVVFETADRVMARAVSPDVSAWFEQTHRDNGIELRLRDSVKVVKGSQKVQQVVAASGDIIDCDLLVAGIGVTPNSELAEAAGIACENGIRVNEYCESSAADVYAVGDCSFHPNPFFSNKMIRLESVQNATDQARVVAGVIAGNRNPYNAVPWFWSDQGEHSLQMTGISAAANLFVRRESNTDGQAGKVSQSFSVFHFGEGRLQCVDSVNSPRDHMVARKLISGRVSPTPSQAADPAFDLKSLL